MSEPIVFALVIERVDIATLTYEATCNDKLMARGNILFDKPDIRNGIQTYRATWYGALM